MDIDTRSVRTALLLAVVVLSLPLASDFATSGQKSPAVEGADTNESAAASARPANGNGTNSQPFRATGRLAYVVDAQGPGQLTVVNRTTGNVIFRTTAYGLYHDVDPSPAGAQTLLYVASNIRGEAACPDHLESPCTRNVVERVNYSTGETKRLYARFLNYNGSSNTHDVDRITDSRYLVGDIQFDRVFVVNTTTDSVEWTWNAASAFDRSTGGKRDDWTHLNDVEVVEEGLYMVNLRNQDQVVFVDRQRGVLENWTLGSEDHYETLYEQHNADYIPAENGGPAVLVADSENNRIVEYQRRNGSWERTWVWTDETLQWPRDADRLPNNNTLITDTHGTRLLEVSPNGTILWKRQVPRGAYEAELLSTGDESAGGRSMARIQAGTNETAVNSVQGVGSRLQKAFLGLFPPLVLHGFLYVLPTWVSPTAGALLLLDIGLVALWSTGEGIGVALGRLRDEE